MKLKDVVPWGRNKKEYIKMFLLTEDDLAKKILSCGDGPSSFNSESEGVTSIDPIYSFTPEEIKSRINETKNIVKEQMLQNKDDFLWDEFKDVDHLLDSRLDSMDKFLNDFENGKNQKRYIHASLPELPFKDGEFQLALSSHFLFLYSDNLDLEFHIKSVEEMLRVSNEVRIFPILNLDCKESRHLKGVIDHLDSKGYESELVKTNYEFQKGANTMLRVIRW